MIDLQHIAEPVIEIIEIGGFTIIVLGMLWTSVHVIYKRLTGQMRPEEAYFRTRKGNGRSLILGLEFLVAAEIIRSISTETLEAVGILAAVVTIRTFLAIAVEVETEGHWPWNRHKHYRRRTRTDEDAED